MSEDQAQGLDETSNEATVPAEKVAKEPKAKKEKVAKEPRSVLTLEQRRKAASEASKKSRATKKGAGFTYFQTAVPTVMFEDIKHLVKDFIASRTV